MFYELQGEVIEAVDQVALEQGKQYLIEIYGKHSRQFLSDEELFEFWDYFQGKLTPSDSPKSH